MALNQTAFVICSLRARNGKTVLARALYDYLTLTRSEPIIFDTDVPQGGIAQSFPSRSMLVELDKVPGQMKLFDTLLSGFSDTYIIDLSHRYFEAFFQNVKTIRFEQEAVRKDLDLVVLYILDTDRSARRVFPILEADFPGMRFFAVENEGLRGSASLQPPLLNEVIDVVMPKLDPMISPIVGNPDFSFAKFLDYEPEDISIVARAAIRSWVHDMFEQMRRLSLKVSFSGSETLRLR